jgi:hypothetical protein
VTAPVPIGAAIKAARATLGISQAELGARWGVSSRMIRKLETGATRGENYRASVEALSRGRLTPPVRRAQRVRAPGGGTRLPAAPPPPSSRSAFGVDVIALPGGGRRVVVTAPRSNGPGRERARQAILAEVRRAARTGGRRIMRQRVTGYRIAFQLGTVEPEGKGEIGKKGGYDPSKVLAGMRGEGQDPFAWLEIEAEGSEYGYPGGTIVQTVITYV